MRGIAGRFLRSFGLTMAFAIAVSMLVSFSLTPMLAARWLKPRATARARRPSLLERGVDVFYRPIERAYMVVLALGDAAPLGRGPGVRGHARLVRAPRQGAARGLPPGGRPGAVRDQRARARGDEPHRDPPHRRAHRRGRAPAPGRGAHADDRRRGRPARRQRGRAPTSSSSTPRRARSGRSS